LVVADLGTMDDWVTSQSLLKWMGVW
jgi:hypothetical protein